MLDIHSLSFGAADRGLPLPEGLKQRMEMLFGTSFADVRVHLSRQPEALGALAFTHGSDVYFEPEVFDPDSPEGWQLIGHELAHVRQSQRGWLLAPEGIGVRLLVDPVLEAEADRMAALARRAYAVEATLPLPTRRVRGPHRWDVVQALLPRR